MPHPNPIKQYLLRHIQAGFSSIGQLSRAPLATLVTCFVIGIALALPTVLFVVLKNMDALSHQFQQDTQITLYLKSSVTENQANTLAQQIKLLNSVSSVDTISPAAGLKELQARDSTDNLLANLQTNPLPWALVILPVAAIHTSADLAAFSQTLKQFPAVDSIQLDASWIERLFAILTLAHHAIDALAIFLAIGVLLIVNNCIRSATLHHQKEIDVIKLIGGTTAFIRRPFLYTGMIYGLLGGIIAWQLVDGLLLWMAGPAAHLAALYHSQFHWIGMGLLETFLLLIISIALGLIGASLAVSRYLTTAQR